MIWALFAGAVAGAGAYALVRVFLRPRPGVATLVARIDSRSMQTKVMSAHEASRQSSTSSNGLMARFADWCDVQASERGWKLGGVRKDLALMNRPLGQFLAVKVLLASGFMLLVPIVWGLLLAVGVPLPSAAPALLALVAAAFGFFLPDLALKGEAASRRRDFRRVVGVFLDLVAMNLAGGRGLPEALLAASTVSDHWALVRIRQTLANARLLGKTPWAALGDLGDQIGLEELRDLSGALSLAADDGAKIRSSLSARAATMRRKELADAEGKAGEKSQSMLVAQLLICAAFMVFLGYPAVSRMLAVG